MEEPEQQQNGGIIEPELSTPLDGYRSCQATGQALLKNGTQTIAPEVELNRTEKGSLLERSHWMALSLMLSRVGVF